MASDRDRMLVGEPYLADDPQLIADRRRCRLLTEQLNSTSVAVLATGVIVGPGVTIGEDSVVGAGSVVTKIYRRVTCASATPAGSYASSEPGSA